MFEQNLIPRQTIGAMVTAYDKAVSEIHAAYDSMATARRVMDGAFGQKELWPTLNDTLRDRRDPALRNLKVAAWKYVVEQTGVKNVMTEQRVANLKAQFKSGELPDFTFDAVISMLDSLRCDVGTLMTESVKEVYELLRPRVIGNRQRYKTNSEYEVGDKAILENVFYVWKGATWHDVHFQEDSQTLTSLDNVFHLLDGKGVAKHPKDLKTAVKMAHEAKEWQCETEYFKCKWYKKGSFHIEFKRTDLVNELNRIAGGARLKQAEV